MKKISSLIVAGCMVVAMSAGLQAQPSIVSYTNSLTVGATIPDGDSSGLASVMNIQGCPVGQITSINVLLNVSGTFNGDLYVYLTKQSKISHLVNRTGRRTGDNLGYADDGLNVRLKDGVANGDIHVYRLTLNGDHAVGLTPLSPLTGDWEPDGRATDPAAVVIGDARPAMLSVFNGEQANGEWVLFVADLEAGDIHVLEGWGLEITGLALPEITQQPASSTVECGDEGFLEVIAQNGPLSYQWQHAGTNIPGATGDTLIIPNMTASKAGSYRVIISNEAGSVTSDAAILTVEDTTPPTITSAPASVNISANETNGAVIPNIVPQVTASDSCPDATVTITQDPPAGTIITPMSGVTEIEITVSDGVNEEYAFTVLNVNWRPVGEPFPAVGLEDQKFFIDLVAFDPHDHSGQLAYVVQVLPTNGTLYGLNENNVATNTFELWSMGPVGARLEYLGNTNFNGLDSLVFVAYDSGALTSAPTLIEITVDNAYDAPTAVNVITNSGENAALTVGFSDLWTSPDALTGLEFYLVDTNVNGVVVPILGGFQYQPIPGFNGTDQYSFIVVDPNAPGGPLTSAVATVTIQVQSQDDVLPYIFDVAFPQDGGMAPRAIAAGDFNNDGKMDVAVANYNDGTVSLLYGNGTNKLTTTNILDLAQSLMLPAFPTPGSIKPIALVAQDFNGDKKTDLAVLCEGTKQVQIWTNTAAAKSASFAIWNTLNVVGDNPKALAAAKMRDAYLDLLVLCAGDDSPGNGQVEWWKNRGPLVGGFTDGAPAETAVLPGAAPRDLAAGLLGAKDQKPDVAVVNAADNSVTILFSTIGSLLTNAGGAPILTANIPVGEWPHAIALGDLNGSKLNDIVVANYDSGDISVITNANNNFLGANSLAFGAGSSGLGPRALAIADFNKDKNLDVAVALAEDNHVSVFTGNGRHSLTNNKPVLEFFWQDPGAYFEVGPGPVAMAAADFNKDTLPDVAVANLNTMDGSDAVSLLLNNWKPIAYKASWTVYEDHAFPMVLGGTRGPLTYYIVKPPTNGVLDITNYNLAAPEPTTESPAGFYRPITNNYGGDSIRFYVDDGTKTSAWATISIKILEVNDQPSWQPAFASVTVGEDAKSVKITNYALNIKLGDPNEIRVPFNESKQTYKFLPSGFPSNLFKGTMGYPKVSVAGPATNKFNVLSFEALPNTFLVGGPVVGEFVLMDNGKTKYPAYGCQDLSEPVELAINITNINDAPVIINKTKVTMQTILEDGSTSWMLHVTDIDDPLENLIVEVASTNNNVINPATDVVVSAGPPTNVVNTTNILITVTPQPDVNGKTLLTFTVRDNNFDNGPEGRAEVKVALTVSPVNDAPSFALVSNPDIEINGPLSAHLANKTNVVVDLGSITYGPPTALDELVQTVGQYYVSTNGEAIFAALPKVNKATGALEYKLSPAVTNLVAPAVATVNVWMKDSAGAFSGTNSLTVTLNP